MTDDAKIEFHTPQAAYAELLSEVRFHSKGYWGHSLETLQSWRPAMQISGAYIQHNHVQSIYHNGALVGFYAIRLDEPPELDHLWLLPEVIGKGIGRKAIEHIFSWAGKQGIQRLRVISDADAEGFYLRFGAQRVGEFFSPVQKRALPVLDLPIPVSGAGRK